MSRPSHYKQGNREIIEIIKDVLSDKTFTGYEGFLIGNVIKYVTRYNHKDGIKDLEKASVYLNWLIEIVRNRSAINDEIVNEVVEEVK